MRIGLRLLAVGLLALVPSVAGAATIVLNGNFESPVLGQPPFFGTTVTDWTLTAETNLETNADYLNLGPPVSGDTGTGQFIAFGGGDLPGGTLTQTGLATVAATQYLISFSYGAFGFAQSLRIQIGNLDTIVTDLTGTTNLTDVLSPYSFLFTASGGDTLLFTDVSGSTLSADGFLDDVVVSEAAPAAVPEPSTVTLLGLGLAGLVRLRKSRAGRRQ